MMRVALSGFVFLVAVSWLGAETKAPDPESYDLTGLAPKLVPFTDEPTARELARRGPVVYFFAASWCPDCHESFEDLKANLYRLPASITVILVDYDRSSELKRKYGVPIQNVFVQIDERGEGLARWVGGGARGLIRNLVYPPSGPAPSSGGAALSRAGAGDEHRL